MEKLRHTIDFVPLGHILLNQALIILQSECIFYEPKIKTSGRPTEK